jgi:hypothetical protein
MKVAIMQPYIFPYLGYFQLLGAVDTFVVYDNIQYTKKGWINRNRILANGQATLFTLPLASGSDYLDIRDRQLAPDYSPEKLLARFTGAYRRAPCFQQTLPLLEEVLRPPDRNLFGYLHHALLRTSAHLGLGTEIRVSSTVPIDHDLKGQDKVLALCEALGAGTYINPIGGVDLYSRSEFADRGVELRFLEMVPFEYPQIGPTFVPSLSIVDVLMHNPIDDIQGWLSTRYRLT